MFLDTNAFDTIAGMNPIESYIAQFTGKTIAVAVHDLATGKSIHIHADEEFHPASTMKVPVMMEVFRLAQTGQLSLQDQLEIINAFHQHRGWQQIFTGHQRRFRNFLVCADR